MIHIRSLLLPVAVAFGMLGVQSGAAYANVTNIVLVHGANVDGSTWRSVYDRFTAEDYKVTIAHMPLTSTEDDLAAVQRSIDVQDGPMLLVGHSYGGVVIAEAGADPDVKGLVYVAAFQPDSGESGAALMAPAPGDFTADKITVFVDGHYLIDEDAFISFVGNGMTPEDATFIARSQAASNIVILEYQTREAAWTEKPSWSIIATRDLIITPELQRRMAERARSTIVTVENGHMLPMTNADEAADIIQKAAEALE